MKPMVAVGVACVLLVACGEREVDLGSGYKYVQLDGANFAISKGTRMVVDPNVVSYKVIGTFIVGDREKPSVIDDPRFSKDFGYFIVDTKSGQFVAGLDRSRFDDALRSRNLDINLF
ncbi:MAG TPA: hypothetical protein VFW28_05430 [Micropepsaceae bacterium]|nr:hypothetical protein [Micropepsaceae bacterium]